LHDARPVLERTRKMPGSAAVILLITALIGICSAPAAELQFLDVEHETLAAYVPAQVPVDGYFRADRASR
jgi:hypothetical protein